MLAGKNVTGMENKYNTHVVVVVARIPAPYKYNHYNSQENVVRVNKGMGYYTNRFAVFTGVRTHESSFAGL